MADKTIVFQAIGTAWFIDLPDKYLSLETEILNVVHKFEADYSRFKPSSYVSQLNTTGVVTKPNQEFVDMLDFANDTYFKSGGLFNISVGGQLENNGYGQVPSRPNKIYSNYTKYLTIQPDSVTISKPDMHIDFGGFGKGWLIDKLANKLNEAGVPKYIINGGGDIYSHGSQQSVIYIEDPTKPDYYIGKVNIKNQSLASSSNIKRTWQVNGNEYSHIVDPTGKNSHDIASVHVIAKTSLLADTVATILYIANSFKRPDIAKIFDVEYLIVTDGLKTSSSPGFKLLI